MMMNLFCRVWLFAAILVVAFLIVSGNVTPSEQCPGESFEGLRDRIQVIPCTPKKCKLKQHTNITVIFKFYAKEKIPAIWNEVNADVGGLKLPFLGVHGTDACKNVKRADTNEDVSCPLPAGHEYIYTNVFPIQPFYPTVNMRVHWSLNDPDSHSLICFEVPAVITAGRSKN